MLVGMLSVRSFGRLADGTEVKLYTVQREGIEAAFLDYGARLVSLKVPDASHPNLLYGSGWVGVTAANMKDYNF